MRPTLFTYPNDAFVGVKAFDGGLCTAQYFHGSDKVSVMKEQAKFHWGEGIRLAIEAIKMLFFLNGAATISVITFIGNLKQPSEMLVFAMQLFAFGAGLAPVALALGYISQMYFGKAEETFDPGQNWIVAGLVHYSVFGVMFVSWALFLAGARFAALGFNALSF